MRIEKRTLRFKAGESIMPIARELSRWKSNYFKVYPDIFREGVFHHYFNDKEKLIKDTDVILLLFMTHRDLVDECSELPDGEYEVMLNEKDKI